MKLLTAVKTTLIGSAIAAAALISVSSPAAAQAGTIPNTIYLPLITNSNGVTSTVNTEFYAPRLVEAINPLANDYDMSFSVETTEGRALDYVNNKSVIIKNRETLTGTGNINVREFTGELGDLPVLGKAYLYTYHTQSRDYGMIQYRAYDRLADGRYMTFTLIGKYSMDAYNAQLQLHPDYEFADSYSFLNSMIERIHPSPIMYYTHKVKE